jgi:hypothetical protein
MAELLERWLEWRPTVRPIAPTTVSSYRAAMDRYILPALGKLPVRQVDAATLDAFYARLRTGGGRDGRPLKASTVHEVHAVLSGALKQAVVWGWVGHNPAKLATAPSVEKADVQPPQAEDAARLLSAATRPVLEHFRDVTRLLDSPLPVARRQRLAVVAGHLAGLAGSLAFDLRDEGKALAYFKVAVQAADDADSPDLAVWALATRSLIPTYTGDPRTALKLLQVAQGPRPRPRQPRPAGVAGRPGGASARRPR